MKEFPVLFAFMLLPFLGWAQVNTAASTVTAGIKPPNEVQQEQKHQHQLKTKHKSWNSCFLVLLNGDTVKGKVKQRPDYSVSRGTFFEGKILFAHADEKEETIFASAFRELYLPQQDSAFRKYITINKDTNNTARKIYRVVTDGNCQLLFDEIPASLGIPVITPPEERYYIYYKNKLTRMSREAYFNLSAGFKKKYKEIFSDCPQLVDKIENKTYKADDLALIVTEFNQCIANTGIKGKHE